MLTLTATSSLAGLFLILISLASSPDAKKENGENQVSLYRHSYTKPVYRTMSNQKDHAKYYQPVYVIKSNKDLENTDTPQDSFPLN